MVLLVGDHFSQHCAQHCPKQRPNHSMLCSVAQCKKYCGSSTRKTLFLFLSKLCEHGDVLSLSINVYVHCFLSAFCGVFTMNKNVLLKQKMKNWYVLLKHKLNVTYFHQRVFFPISDLIITCEQTQRCLVEKCYSSSRLMCFIEENSGVKRLYFSINFNSY